MRFRQWVNCARTGCTVLVVLLIEAMAVGGTIYVDASAPPMGSGDNWESALRFLQDAMSVAQPGDAIHVAQGTYTPDRSEYGYAVSGDRNASFPLHGGVAVYGGFAGRGAADPETRDVAAYPTILSGDLLGDDVGWNNRSDNSERIASVSGTGVALLDGVSVCGGLAYSGPFPRAAVYSVGADLNLVHCTVTMNYTAAGPQTAAIFSSGGSVALTECDVSHNFGGGLKFDGSNAILTRCTIENNTASDDMHSSATGVHSNAGLTLRDCRIVGNHGHGQGAVAAGYVTVQRCVFLHNIAGGWQENSGFGGAINAGSATVMDSIFVNNSAVLQNIASRGGAICISGGIVTDCTFVHNTAGYVGAPNCLGGAIYSAGSVTVQNCVLRADSPNEVDGPVHTVNFCDIEGNHAGTGNFDEDPLFRRAPGPGLDGQWGTGDDDYGDLRLQAGSRCIDAGNNAAVDPTSMVDLDGRPRFFDDPATPDTGVGTPPIVDMGAYEFQGTPAVCGGDTDCDGRVGFSDIDFFVVAIPDDSVAWRSLYVERHGGAEPPCVFGNGDITGDGHVNFADIDPFVALIPSGCPIAEAVPSEARLPPAEFRGVLVSERGVR